MSDALSLVMTKNDLPIFAHELASVRGGVYGHTGQGAPLTAWQQERLKNCWQVDADNFLCGRDVLNRSQIPETKPEE